MPHNRTRVWTGLAIVAVTIPAVGTYYFGANSPALQGAPITVVGRAGVSPLGDMPSDRSDTARVARRDYMAEVRAATGAGGSTTSDDAAELAAMDDELFDPSPLEDGDARVAYDPEGEAPDPAGDVALAVADPMTIQAAYTADAPVDDEPATTPPATPTLSDANVYRLVVNNLPEDDRDEFVRAYAAMTNAQRVELLDGFRAQLENDAP